MDGKWMEKGWKRSKMDGKNRVKNKMDEKYGNGWKKDGKRLAAGIPY